MGFEAGEPMREIRVGDWPALGEAASAIRSEVFIAEQKIPQEMEWDADDATSVHAVAFNRLGFPIATGRLLRDAPGIARIGRMATRQAVRGGGIARAVLEALMDRARERGDREVRLSAQTSAAAFYARAGFVTLGAEFEEAGIAHIEMTRAL